MWIVTSLTCILLVCTIVIGSPTTFESQISTEELYATFKHEAGDLLNSPTFCDKVSNPIKNGEADIDKTTATIKFGWIDAGGKCPNAHFEFTLYTADHNFVTQAVATNGHLRGFVYQNLKAKTDYYVAILARDKGSNKKSEPLTLQIKILQQDATSQMAIPNHHYAEFPFAMPKCPPPVVHPITNVVVSGITAKEATVKFTWAPSGPTCYGVFKTQLRERNARSISASLSHHFRGHLYYNLANGTEYEEHTFVEGLSTISKPVVTTIITK